MLRGNELEECPTYLTNLNRSHLQVKGTRQRNAAKVRDNGRSKILNAAMCFRQSLFCKICHIVSIRERGNVLDGRKKTCLGKYLLYIL